MASTAQGIKFTFRNPATDKPLSFGKVYTYESGTSSPKVTYSDEGKLAQNTNPVILDANGQANICLEGRYKIIVKDSLDVAIDTVDPISDAATQAKDFVGSIYGFGTSAIKNVGESYGDVMMVGDGSWLGKAKLWPDPLFPAINDLNAMPSELKMYHGTALVNAPTSNHILVEHIPLSDGTATQSVIDLSTGFKFTRVFNGTTWAGWINISASSITNTPAGSIVSTNLQAVVNEIDTRSNNHIPLSGVTSYHLLSGSLTLGNSVVTAGMATTLYTGNGTTQSVVTGVDMATQWGNSANETFGGLVWGKSRSIANNHELYDTIRAATKAIMTSSTAAEQTMVGSLTGFNADGFTLGNAAGLNTNLSTNASWNFQTTHRITGTTNHGKAYTCHYNPFTGFTIIKYEGSGLAGHEIPHHLGRKLGFVTIKNLSSVSDWRTHFNEVDRIILNGTGAKTTDAFTVGLTDSATTFNSSTGVTADWNGATNQLIMYGWANSYFDEANTLIGNYEVGVYQGTGAAGNKVTTRGKPAWVMVKRLDSTGNWVLWDNQRDEISGSNDGNLYANSSSAEDTTANSFTLLSDGFTLNSSTADNNASGGQYLYMAVYDNDSGSGKSKYNKATDTSALSLTATVPFANGLDTNGTKNTVLTKNETVSGLTLTQGKNYVYAKNDGLYGVKAQAPQYGSYNGFGDYFDVNTNKWYQSPSVFSDDFSGALTWSGLGFNGSVYVSAPSDISIVNNELKLLSNTGLTYPMGEKQIITEAGKRYKLVFLNTSSSGVASVYISSSTALGLSGATGDLATATGASIASIFTAKSTTSFITLALVSATVGHVATWDNIAIYPINNDDSVDITSATPITESRNYLNAIVYADAGGQPTYVEQLPKTRYEDAMQVNSLNVLGGFDLNQKVVDKIAIRFLNATYPNTSGKTKRVVVSMSNNTASTYVVAYIDGIPISRTSMPVAGQYITVILDVLPNSNYKLVWNTGTTTISTWMETE